MVTVTLSGMSTVPVFRMVFMSTAEGSTDCEELRATCCLKVLLSRPWLFRFGRYPPYKGSRIHPAPAPSLRHPSWRSSFTLVVGWSVLWGLCVVAVAERGR
eukprot:scaffold22148_cov64-Phaeocystis_antarctica.AAC.6